MLLYPITFFLYKRSIGAFKNLFLILFNIKTFVGFDTLKSIQLPIIKPSIVHPSDIASDKGNNEEIEKLNLIYARNYKVSLDISILTKSIVQLGRKH